jgi:hypothetical protein
MISLIIIVITIKVCGMMHRANILLGYNYVNK